MESRANKRCNDVTWLERDGRRDEGISQRSRYSAGYWKVMLRTVLTLLTNPVVLPSSTISNNKVHESVFASRLRSRTAAIFLQRLDMHRYPFHTKELRAFFEFIYFSLFYTLCDDKFTDLY